MSEEERLLYIQKKLDDAKRREKVGWLSFVVGGLIVAVAFNLRLADQTAGILLEIGGIFLVIVGIFDILYVKLYQKPKLAEQLKKSSHQKQIRLASS